MEDEFVKAAIDAARGYMIDHPRADWLEGASRAAWSHRVRGGENWKVLLNAIKAEFPDRDPFKDSQNAAV